MFAELCRDVASLIISNSGSRDRFQLATTMSRETFKVQGPRLCGIFQGKKTKKSDARFRHLFKRVARLDVTCNRVHHHRTC